MSIQKNKELKIILKGKHLSEKSISLFQNIEISQITDLDLSNNDFTILPNNITQFKSLSFLNISNNPIKDYQQVASKLKQLTNLISLKIDLSEKENVSLILTELPNLLLLNGQPTKSDSNPVNEIDLSDGEMEDYSLNNEIENFNQIINRVSRLSCYSKTFKKDFLIKLKMQIDSLNKNCNIQNYLFAINVLKSKFFMYNYLTEYLFNMLYDDNVDKDTIKSIVNIIKEINIKISSCQEKLIDIIYKLNPRIEQQILFYRKEYYNMREKYQSQERMNKVLYENNKELQEKLNQKQFSKISKIKEEIKSKDSSLSQYHSQSVNKEVFHTNQYKRENYLSNTSPLNREYFIPPPKKNLTTMSSIKKGKSSSTILTSAINPHILSQNQLLQLINEIYISKAQYDQKCFDNHLPKETLEQHMYTYLNNKYGLKNLTIEWASSIINGIQQYSLQNSEVCLFGKIMRNELEEDSYQVYLRLKATVFELLNYYYQTKFPYKSIKDLDKILIDKQNSFLLEEEWKSLIQYLFPKDKEEILQKITDFVQKNYNNKDKKSSSSKSLGNSSNMNTSRKMTRSEIRKDNEKPEELNIKTSDFIKMLLDAQIRIRDKYLANFIYVFKQNDHDSNGIVDENEFKEIIKQLNVYPNEEFEQISEELLEKVDPFNTKVITFSDCVMLLSNESNDNGKTKVLDQVSLMTNIIPNTSEGQ